MRTLNWVRKRVAAVAVAWTCLCGCPVLGARQPVSDANVSARCHIAMARDAWTGDQIVRFYVYVRDSELEFFQLVLLPDLGCMVEVDSAWYRFVERQWVDGLEPDIPVYSVADWGGYLPAALYPRHWRSVVGDRPLKLAPGEHSIRFAWAEVKRGTPLWLISETRDFRIEGTGKANSDERAAEVKELFGEFVGHNAPASPEAQRNLRTDLIRRHRCIPRLDWADIPVLLDLAGNGAPLRGTVPSQAYVSRAIVECPEGMVALWLIEGVRQRQLALTRDPQLAEKLYYPDLPMQPICGRTGTPAWQTENDPAVFRTALAAYQGWWRKVRSLPPDQACAINPLEPTDLTWHGLRP